MEAKRERHEQDAGSAAGGPPVHPMDGAPLYPTESLRDPASSSAYTSYARTDSPYGSAMVPYDAAMPYGGYDAGSAGHMGMHHPHEMIAYYRCMRAYYECLMAYHRYMMMMRDMESSHR
ncbi:hypothetical protein JCM14719A_19400 [Calditerricola satsumensis]|uniref:Uncharacterized protein n=1 Tax=Calditerricola satsumensis TaxID=373054 RepID=A0A8J3BCF5_9BACI|nr:hypothetical protein GCM10007043_05090 [Calditerricola satsumensis]